jgi:hypothetical protein
LTIPENLLTPFLEAFLVGGMGIVAEYDLGENRGEMMIRDVSPMAWIVDLRAMVERKLKIVSA